MAESLHRRLLADIAELQTNPYPNIKLHVDDRDLETPCLVLKTSRYGSIHMTVQIPPQFPLGPPKIRMDSSISHPNIFGSYICASILNTEEGYTPAYTLKGIAIQLLSFFSSDSIEQVGGGKIKLDGYQDRRGHFGLLDDDQPFVCEKCHFGTERNEIPPSNASPVNGVRGKRPHSEFMVSNQETVQDANAIDMPVEDTVRKVKRQFAYIPDTLLKKLSYRKKPLAVSKQEENLPVIEYIGESTTTKLSAIQRANLPDEVLVLICNNLEAENMMTFAQAWSRIGRLIVQEDLIRTRELKCFCLKESYLSTSIGVGVALVHNGRMCSLASEFDLISEEAFTKHRIRNSVQGIYFQHWLPLPISWGHWRRVRSSATTSLRAISISAQLQTTSDAKVLYQFMSDVVVKLNDSNSGVASRSTYPYSDVKSTLTHASEKAIESFFHIFHLLLCLATENPVYVRQANVLLNDFINGQTSKTACPNLGHLVVAALISDIDMDDMVIKAIIKEAVTRNVVWMLDAKGANMPELSYMEPSAVSEYRLKKTFEASKTSYRLLMFLRLFQSVAVGNPRKPLVELRDEAFARHGAPPRGSAKGLADSIKRIHLVDNFPDFLHNMGLKVMPTKESFTSFLRDSITASVDKGYSKMPYTQGEALALRRLREANVEVAQGIEVRYDCVLPKYTIGFFPGKASRGGHGRGRGGGGVGGRGGGRGGY